MIHKKLNKKINIPYQEEISQSQSHAHCLHLNE